MHLLSTGVFLIVGNKLSLNPFPKMMTLLLHQILDQSAFYLLFLKLLRKLQALKCVIFLKDDNQLDKLQSAYKLFHSTNTALLNITDDIYKALDKSQLTILILLDYSKAFDCANHRLILAKLKAAGFQDEALSWVLSYLLDRKQKVRTDLGESRWVTMKNGVPQGSILGPLLFLVLVSDLYKSIIIW